MAPSIRQRHQSRLEGLKQERRPYEARWREYDKYIAPGRLRLDANRHKGEKTMQAILDETALLHRRTFQSGMHSGLTSPVRPWMKLRTMDPDLKEFGPVKDYLFQCERIIQQVLRRSNIYNALHSAYGDLGLFGQSCMVIVGEGDAVRAIPMMSGQYWIAQNDKGRVDTLYRQIKMTVEQVVGKFVTKANGDMDWSRVSNTIKTLWDHGKYDSWVDICHAVEPRKTRDHSRKNKANKPYASNYWEEGASGEGMLSQDGFDINRILAPRYEADGEDVYGSGHPGEVCLPAVKQLQSEQRMKGQGIDKIVRPPMQGPSSLRMAGVSTLPGAINYHDDQTGRAGLRPVMEVNLRLGELMQDIQGIQGRIEKIWYADLFFAISQMQGVQPRNVMELTQRKEEQLLQLGPVVERQIYEQTNPLVEIVYHSCEEAGMLPEPPQELVERQEVLEIENISLLAQAQRAVTTGSIERLVGFAGQILSVKPDVADKLDLDQAIDEYADAIGTPSTLVKSDEAVKEMRDQRQTQMETKDQANLASQIMPAVKDGADAARLMSEAQKNASGSDLLQQLGLA
ncbi:MAG: portal protein [Cohaesibacter sp.]|nr:portal protein [Cohaesibacter sp.]